MLQDKLTSWYDDAAASVLPSVDPRMRTASLDRHRFPGYFILHTHIQKYAFVHTPTQFNHFFINMFILRLVHNTNQLTIQVYSNVNVVLKGQNSYAFDRNTEQGRVIL